MCVKKSVQVVIVLTIAVSLMLSTTAYVKSIEALRWKDSMIDRIESEMSRAKKAFDEATILAKKAAK